MAISNYKIIEFYEKTFIDEELQSRLIVFDKKQDFIEALLLEAKKEGYNFSKDDLLKTISPSEKTDTFDHIFFESPWIKKIVQMGWAPKGYSR